MQNEKHVFYSLFLMLAMAVVRSQIRLSDLETSRICLKDPSLWNSLKVATMRKECCPNFIAVKANLRKAIKVATCWVGKLALQLLKVELEAARRPESGAGTKPSGDKWNR